MNKAGIVAAVLALCAAGCKNDAAPVPTAGSSSATSAASAPRPPSAGLAAFRSEKELIDYLKARPLPARARGAANASPVSPEPAAAPAEESKAQSGADESVTNVQHAGVDEGGIVKVHGDHLVVLRRGRLFTLHVGDGALTPVSTVDAFGPDVDPRGAWYDEMLIAKGTVIVIGYSYQRGGTEIGLFDIDDAGKLAYRATYQLRSNDYYSSRNYASRLIGSKLVFYSPLYLRSNASDPLAGFPALRRWKKHASDADFRTIAEPTRVYRPLTDPQTLALHTVTVCDTAARELDCKATAVMGPPGRVFYVSPSSVYVWMTEWRRDPGQSAGTTRSLAYRLPLDGGAPSAVRVAGSPVDQFSFLEGADEHLNVVVRADASGESMWSSEVTVGDVALLRVPLSSFSGAGTSVPSSAYKRLPKPSGYTFQNRFIGEFLLYGSGSGWGRAQPGTGSLYAHRFASDGEATVLDLGHGVDRIEALGKNAVVVGTDGSDLHFSPLALGDRQPRLAPRYTRKNASQGELRSHGFFYKPSDDERGLLGLPIRGSGGRGGAHLLHGSASVLFLENQGLAFEELGELSAGETQPNDGCRASCVDWYGNARPLFLAGRIFALLGYEIVEGAVENGKLGERRRVSFAPQAGLGPR